MDKLKQYIALTVVGCLAILAAGWYLLVSPKRDEAAALRADTEAQVSANAALRTQITVLKAQAADLPKQQARLAAVAAKIPSSRSMPALIRALTVAAQDADVELLTLAPGPTAAVAAAPAAAPVAPPEDTTTSTSAKAKRPKAAAAPPAPAGQLATIPVSMTVAGGYFQIQRFLSNVEDLKRAMRFMTISIAPGGNPIKPATGVAVEDGRSLVASLSGQVFQVVGAPSAPVVPAAPGASPAAAAPGAPVAPVAPVASATPAK